jgi:hypothetical protein
MLVPAVLAAYIILPYALSFIAPDKISVEEITRIKYLFIALSAWYFLIAAESPFVLLVISARKSLLFIRTNTVCIIIIFSFCFLFKSYFGVFVLPLALFAGQVHNTVIYIKNALFIIESENNNGNNGVNIAV